LGGPALLEVGRSEWEQLEETVGDRLGACESEEDVHFVHFESVGHAFWCDFACDCSFEEEDIQERVSHRLCRLQSCCTDADCVGEPVSFPVASGALREEVSLQLHLVDFTWAAVNAADATRC
jgi:hypothetical protein